MEPKAPFSSSDGTESLGVTVHLRLGVALCCSSLVLLAWTVTSTAAAQLQPDPAPGGARNRPRPGARDLARRARAPPAGGIHGPGSTRSARFTRSTGAVGACTGRAAVHAQPVARRAVEAGHGDPRAQ